MYFTAIEPPGNIQKPFYSLQNLLFRDYGISGAKLFPPLIPVYAGELSKAIGGRILSAVAAAPSFQAIPCIVQEGNSFISPLQSPAALSDFVLTDPNTLPCPSPHALRDLFASEFPAMFLGIGFQKEIQFPEQEAKGISHVTWKKMKIVEILLKCEDSPRWWADAVWEYTKTVPACCGRG